MALQKVMPVPWAVSSGRTFSDIFCSCTSCFCILQAPFLMLTSVGTQSTPLGSSEGLPCTKCFLQMRIPDVGHQSTARRQQTPLIHNFVLSLSERGKRKNQYGHDETPRFVQLSAAQEESMTDNKRLRKRISASIRYFCRSFFVI